MAILCKKCSEPIDINKWTALARKLCHGYLTVEFSAGALAYARVDNVSLAQNCRTTIKAIYHYSICKTVA